MKPGIGECARLPLIDTHPLNYARGNIMPLHAGDGARITASTATEVNKETMLGHGKSPWYLSTWTRFDACAGVTELSKSPPSKVDGDAP